METQIFNLTTDPWIKVIESATNKEKTFSLIDLFKNAQNYRQLAGDMRSQDFVMLRLLLAIATTVYSRVDPEGKPYDWLDVDDKLRIVGEIEQDYYEEDDLLETWQRLNDGRHFTTVLTKYLTENKDCFDLFGDHPFYQVTAAEFDALVPDGKKIATGKGTVGVKQINRRISESGHTLDVFSPKAGDFKNRVSIDELARWLMMYQNVSGVTDKTKVKTDEPFSVSTGWVYGLNPVFAHGDTLFDTLMLNLILVDDADQYPVQKPVWEYASIVDYVNERKKERVPDNLAALYTSWSRLLHVEWQINDQPTIFSAGVPIFDNKNCFIEPMTIWRREPKKGHYTPLYRDVKTLAPAMWRNFGLYVSVNEDDGVHEPGIVDWLQRLKEEDLVSQNQPLTLESINILNDGNSASQTPAAEIDDDMRINADVLFAEDPTDANYWPQQIEDVIQLTQRIGSDYRSFGYDIANIRRLNNSDFPNNITAVFYDRLNEPFKAWLSGLTNEDDHKQKILDWELELRKIVFDSAQQMMNSATAKDVKGAMVDSRGKKKEKIYLNIFIAMNSLKRNVYTHLKLIKKG